MFAIKIFVKFIFCIFKTKSQKSMIEKGLAFHFSALINIAKIANMHEFAKINVAKNI